MLGRCCRGLNACAVLAVALLVLLASRHACAEELGPTLLSYRAPEGCPGVAEFQRSVQRRSARVHFVDEGAHDRELSIVMRQDGEATKGELRLLEPGGSVRQRHVRFTTCSEAVEGLALIAVVSLDPQALLESDKPAEPAEPPSVPKPAVKPAAAKIETQPKRDLVPVAQPSKIQWAVGGEFNIAIRALPASALGGSLFMEVAARSQSWSSPLFRIAISHVQRRGLESGDAEANFTLTLATLSACPLRAAANFVVLRTCAFASGGALHAWGSSTTNLQQRTRPYGVVGGSLSVGAQISQTVEMVTDLAAGTTLLRDSFGFDQEQAWKTPALYLSSGIGARFMFR